MTPASATQLSRILLVGEPESPRPAPGRQGPAIRRYRLARLRLNARPADGDRYAHLKRSYD